MPSHVLRQLLTKWYALTLRAILLTLTHTASFAKRLISLADSTVWRSQRWPRASTCLKTHTDPDYSTPRTSFGRCSTSHTRVHCSPSVSEAFPFHKATNIRLTSNAGTKSWTTQMPTPTCATFG